MKLILYFIAASSLAQPFDATTNTIVAPVLGSTYTTTDGTNWTPVDALMIRFDVADTNDVPIDPPPPPIGVRSIRTKIAAMARQSKIVAASARTNSTAVKSASAVSDTDATTTYTVHLTCPHCGRKIERNVALKTVTPTIEEVR